MRFVLNGYREDCTMPVRFSYNLCKVSVLTAPFCRRKKSRVIVKNENTYVAANSHLRVLKNRTENRKQKNRSMPMAHITEVKKEHA